MSSVAEMQSLAHEAADLTALSSNWKDRVQAAARAVDLSFGRAKRLYFREARRVDAGEMDRARAAIEELREASLRREASAHLTWLRSTVEQVREAGEELDGFDVAGLERALARVGARHRAVGHSSAEFDADFDQRKWGR
jgi:hypothetical protein